MVPRTFLFIFHAGSRRLDSNNFWNSSYKEKTAGSAGFHCVKNHFLTEQSLSQINLFPIINLFPLVEKKKIKYEKTVSTRQKTIRNEKFVKKYVSTRQKMASA